MSYFTYPVLGLCAGLLVSHNPFQLILCIIGSVLPFLDELLKGQGRGIFHSLLLILAMYFVSIYLFIGLLIHAVFTMVSEDGGPLFWPYKENVRFPLMFPLRKGSYVEIAIVIFAGLACFVLLIGQWTPIFHGVR